MKSNVLLGHTLIAEGAPYDDRGHRIFRGISPHGVSGEGRAMCSCGELSPVFPSAYQRKAWHRDEHKPSIRAMRAQQG